MKKSILHSNYSILLFIWLLGGCTMAPGIYTDQIDTSKQQMTPEQALGGKIEIVPLTAHKAAQLKLDRIIELKHKRQQANELFNKYESQTNGYQYKVGSNDIINITVWGHPELNILAMSSKPGIAPQPVAAFGLDPKAAGRAAVATGHHVDSEGNIYFPYLNTVHVAGKTTSEIRALMIKKIAAYIPEPKLDVGVSAYRSQRVYVLGQVNKARALPINDVGLELIDAITRAGGYTATADTRNVVLIRKNRKYQIDLESIYEDGNLTQNYILKHGDVIQVPESRENAVYALGEFNKSARLTLPPRLFSLLDLINSNAVRGIKPGSIDASRIFVFRLQEDKYDVNNKTFTAKPVAYHLDASSAEAMLIAANFPMESKDVVFAAPTKLTRWNRIVQQVLPTLQMIWYPFRYKRDWYTGDYYNKAEDFTEQRIEELLNE